MPQRYSIAAIILHWAIAALLAFQIAVGWALEDLGARGFNLFQLRPSPLFEGNGDLRVLWIIL